jgi:hypothetical protein
MASVLKLVLVQPPSPADADMFDAPAGDPGHAPWIALRNRLRDQGTEIDTTLRRPGDIERADWVCFMNVPAELRAEGWSLRALVGLWRRPPPPGADAWARLQKAGRATRAAVFLWEPHVVLPENYDDRLHDGFARVFTWSTDLVERGGRYRAVVWPQPSGWSVPAGEPFARRKLLANFSGNKTSGLPHELYSARVQVIRYMEQHHPEQFDHYGPGWSAEFPSWRGAVPSKFDVYPGYRFGLCYENMHSVRGYVTEKVFDCLRAGVVPVYWGAPDIDGIVDPAAFIDRRRFGSTQELVDHLLSIDESTWRRMREAGAAYLAGPGFQPFLPPAFAQTVIQGLQV